MVNPDASHHHQRCRQMLAERGMAGQIATRGQAAPTHVDRRWPVAVSSASRSRQQALAGEPANQFL
jgi:hypothetical protein